MNKEPRNSIFIVNAVARYYNLPVLPPSLLHGGRSVAHVLVGFTKVRSSSNEDEILNTNQIFQALVVMANIF
jgi:hypothetical protein